MLFTSSLKMGHTGQVFPRGPLAMTVEDFYFLKYTDELGPLLL